MKHGVFGPTQSVAGGGVYSDFEHVSVCLSTVHDVSMFITGGGKGIEALAERFAEETGKSFERIRPNFHSLFGSKIKNPNVKIDSLPVSLRQQVFAARNDEIIMRSDRVIFFWDGEFFEIGQLIRRAISLKKSVLVFPLKGN